jgi:membrane-associated PAP2 superfamily phosphatase
MRSARRRLTIGFVGALLCLGIVLTGWIASNAWGQRLDRQVGKALVASGTSELYNDSYDTDVDVERVTIVAVAISCVLALLLWGPRRAIVIVASVVLAGALAELLKRLALVTTPSDVPPTASSWPSAHASSLTALDLSILMLPRRRSSRWLVGLVATGYLVVVCLSVLVTGAHQLTDVLGGCLTGAWAFAFVAAVVDPWHSAYG